MDFETFKKATELDDYITIGGGEPTLHPQFEKILLYSLGHCESVFIVTNGTNKELSLTMLMMAKSMEDKFGCVLSVDPYHDLSLVDNEVMYEFEQAKRIRNTSKNISATGRGKKISGSKKFCVCDDLIVKPNGDIKYCGCDNAPKVGDVFTGMDREYWEIRSNQDSMCWNEREEEEVA